MRHWQVAKPSFIVADGLREEPRDNSQRQGCNVFVGQDSTLKLHLARLTVLATRNKEHLKLCFLHKK